MARALLPSPPQTPSSTASSTALCLTRNPKPLHSVCCASPPEGNSLEDHSATGAVVWDSSIVLAKYLERIAATHGPMVGTCVELGSGCGLLGLACARLGLRCTLTDRAELLPLLHSNARANADSLGPEPCLDSQPDRRLESDVVRDRHPNAISNPTANPNPSCAAPQTELHHHVTTSGAATDGRWNQCTNGGINGAGSAVTAEGATLQPDDADAGRCYRVGPGTVRICEYLWGTEPPLSLPCPPDFLVAADVLYDRVALKPLCAGIARLCGPDTTVLMAYDQAVGRDAVQQAFVDMSRVDPVLDWQWILQEEYHPQYQRDTVRLLHATRRPEVVG